MKKQAPIVRIEACGACQKTIINNKEKLPSQDETYNIDLALLTD